MLRLGISVKQMFNFLQFYLSTFYFSTVEIMCYHGITLNGECGVNNSRWEKLIKQ